MLSGGQRVELPVGEILVSLLRRGCALAVDTFVLGFPFLVAGVYLFARNCGISATDGVVLSVGGALVAVLYHTVAIAVWGRTIGKAMFGCRVVRADDGHRVTWGQAAMRAVVVAVASAIPAVGPVAVFAVYAAAWRHRHQQGLHDRAAATIVVLD